MVYESANPYLIIGLLRKNRGLNYCVVCGNFTWDFGSPGINIYCGNY